MNDDGQVYFRTRDHPDHPSNPTGKICGNCSEPAFIVTERLVTVDGGLNQVETGEPFCRKHFREAINEDHER